MKDNNGNIISSLDRNSVDRLTQSGAITGGMIAKVRGALEASEQAGVATLVAGWNDPNVLQTLSNAGTETFSGTLFLPLQQACNS